MDDGYSELWEGEDIEPWKPNNPRSGSLLVSV
jgi:hypothetical protein